MAGDAGPSLGQVILTHMPWLVSIALFLAGLWSALISWLWRRQTQRIDDHSERIRGLERGKADRQQVERLESWLREDVGALHAKLDRALGHRE